MRARPPHGLLMRCALVLLIAALNTGEGVALTNAADGRKFSAHKCLGPSFFFDNNCQTCMYRNVCYNTNSGRFIYYRDPSLAAVPLMYDLKGSPHAAFPPLFSFSRLLRFPYTYDFTPLVEHAPLPADTAKHMGERTYIFSGYVDSNVFNNLGHYWWEFALPLYTMVSMFPSDHQLPPRLLMHKNFSSSELGSDCEGNLWDERNSRCTYSWLASIFGKEVPLMLHQLADDYRDRRQQLAERTTMSPLVCFDRIVVREFCLNKMYKQEFSGPDASGFHKHVAHALGLPLDRMSSRVKIGVAIKQGRRIPSNYADILEALRKSFPLVDVLDISIKRSMPAPKQVEIMRQLTILVTPGGGISTMSIFLPRGSSAIIFGMWDAVTNRTIEYDHSMYERFSHFTVQVFPVLKEDYQRSPLHDAQFNKGPDANHLNAWGPYVFADYWVNTTRLVHTVAQTLHSWHVQTSPPDAPKAVYVPTPYTHKEPTSWVGRGKECFDVLFYRDHNPDLKALPKEELWNHFSNAGVGENRTYRMKASCLE